MSGMRTTRQRRRGFTLIELLIVISIILVILAIAVPKMNTQMQGAREMAVIREIGSIHQPRHSTTLSSGSSRGICPSSVRR